MMGEHHQQLILDFDEISKLFDTKLEKCIGTVPRIHQFTKYLM